MAIQVSYNQKIYRNLGKRIYCPYQTVQGFGLQASHNPNLRVGRRDYCKRQENRSDTCMEMVT